MIEKRQESFVISRTLVPVNAICESVASGLELEDLKYKYPLKDHEVFEAIDFYADNTILPENDDVIILENRGTQDDAQIEVKEMSQTAMLKLIAYARKYYPEIVDFNKLISTGMRIISVENMLDVKNGKTGHRSRLHMHVHSEITKFVVDWSEQNIDLMLEDLEYKDVLDRLQ